MGLSNGFDKAPTQAGRAFTKVARRKPSKGEWAARRFWGDDYGRATPSLRHRPKNVILIVAGYSSWLSRGTGQ